MNVATSLYWFTTYISHFHQQPLATFSITQWNEEAFGYASGELDLTRFSPSSPLNVQASFCLCKTACYSVLAGDGCGEWPGDCADDWHRGACHGCLCPQLGGVPEGSDLHTDSGTHTHSLILKVHYIKVLALLACLKEKWEYSLTHIIKHNPKIMLSCTDRQGEKSFHVVPPFSCAVSSYSWARFRLPPPRRVRGLPLQPSSLPPSNPSPSPSECVFNTGPSLWLSSHCAL